MVSFVLALCNWESRSTTTESNNLVAIWARQLAKRDDDLRDIQQRVCHRL